MLKHILPHVQSHDVFDCEFQMHSCGHHFECICVCARVWAGVSMTTSECERECACVCPRA